MDTYADQPAREVPLPAIRSQGYSLPYQEPVSVAAVYTALKQLPDFADAQDA